MESSSSLGIVVNGQVGGQVQDILCQDALFCSIKYSSNISTSVCVSQLSTLVSID